VIPNYVRQDKFELLSWAGMNRVRPATLDVAADDAHGARQPRAATALPAARADPADAVSEQAGAQPHPRHGLFDHPRPLGLHLWKIGLVPLWQKRLWRRPARPARTVVKKAGGRDEIKVGFR